MDISVGIMAHNEEGNLERLLTSLLTQKTKKISIKKIMVVISGEDRSASIIRNFSMKDRRISKIIEPAPRAGKYRAINLFLATSKSNINVLLSADIFLAPDALEELCAPLIEGKIGMVGGHPIPVNRGAGLLNFAVRLQWKLHHLLSLKEVKCGEIIAFKKCFPSIPPTSVDEECIAAIIRENGLDSVYAAHAIAYNRGPATIEEYIKQRRRIFAGHKFLEKKLLYVSPSLKWKLVVRSLIEAADFKHIHLLIAAVLLEAYARMLGQFDALTKQEAYVWEPAASTKNLFKIGEK